MGFEQNYERAVGTAWGDAIRAFRKSCDDIDVAKKVESAIGHEFNHGDFKAVCALTMRFQDAVQQTIAAPQSKYPFESSDEIAILDRFRQMCAGDMNNNGSAAVNEQFCSTAAIMLRDRTVDPDRFADVTSRQSAIDLAVNVVKRCAEANLNIAAEVCARRTCETPGEALDRLNSVLGFTRIEQMVIKAIDNPAKPVRAPITRKPSVDDFLNAPIDLGEL